MERIVIIGAGHSAVEAALTLRKKGWKHDICILSQESALPYQRPQLSKGYIDGSVLEEKLALKQREIYNKNNIEIKLGTKAIKINRSRRIIETSKNENIPYSHLIIATGTRPRPLTISGSDLLDVNYLRSLDDAKKIKSKLAAGKRLLVIGAGYIGLELAASATKLNCKVTVVEAEKRVLARVTSEVVSTFFQNLHRAHGIAIKLNTNIQTIHKVSSGFEAIMSDATTIEFDTIVVGIGVLPNTQLAEESGLVCSNGIVVNERAQTSDPLIYAIGDCSNHPNKFYQKQIRLESIPNALEQARVAAANICGSPSSYNSIPWFWSNQYNVKLQTVGLSEGYEEIVVRGTPADNVFCVFYLKDKRLIAMDAINSSADFLKAKTHILNKNTITTAQLTETSKAWFEPA